MSSEDDANDLTLRQLRQMASNLGIGRYSRMLKDQLLKAIERKSDSQPAASQPGGEIGRASCRERV